MLAALYTGAALLVYGIERPTLSLRGIRAGRANGKLTSARAPLKNGRTHTP
jgi:hypothetical protein